MIREPLALKVIPAGIVFGLWVYIGFIIFTDDTVPLISFGFLTGLAVFVIAMLKSLVWDRLDENQKRVDQAERNQVE